MRRLAAAGVGLGAFLVVTPAAAQSVDWRAAGGDMFGRSAPETPVADVETAGDVLPSLTQPYQAAIETAALAHGLDPKLLHALVITESAYEVRAVSPVGAGGLTQLMPGTARELGVVDRFDVAQNLRGGASYLAQQLVRFRDLRLALAAYNAGPSRVERLGRVPDILETRQYVSSVIDCYLALTAGQGPRNARQCRNERTIP